MKKKFLVGAILLIALLFLTGCSAKPITIQVTGAENVVSCKDASPQNYFYGGHFAAGQVEAMETKAKGEELYKVYPPELEGTRSDHVCIRREGVVVVESDEMEAQAAANETPDETPNEKGVNTNAIKGLFQSWEPLGKFSELVETLLGRLGKVNPVTIRILNEVQNEKFGWKFASVAILMWCFHYVRKAVKNEAIHDKKKESVDLFNITLFALFAMPLLFLFFTDVDDWRIAALGTFEFFVPTSLTSIAVCWGLPFIVEVLGISMVFRFKAKVRVARGKGKKVGIADATHAGILAGSYFVSEPKPVDATKTKLTSINPYNPGQYLGGEKGGPAHFEVTIHNLGWRLDASLIIAIVYFALLMNYIFGVAFIPFVGIQARVLGNVGIGNIILLILAFGLSIYEQIGEYKGVNWVNPSFTSIIANLFVFGTLPLILPWLGHFTALGISDEENKTSREAESEPLTVFIMILLTANVLFNPAGMFPLSELVVTPAPGMPIFFGPIKEAILGLFTK